METIETEILYDVTNQQAGEINLWRAVISKAIEDLKLPPTNKRYRTWRKQAYEWFVQADSDFLEVCEKAQVSPEFILRSVYEIIKTIS